MTLDGKILRGLFEHERLKPTDIRMSQKNAPKFSTIKVNYESRFNNLLESISQLSY